MTDWIRNQPLSSPSKQLGPLQLAWLGDSIWELHQKLKHCQFPARPRDLHLSVVAEVNADAQAKAVKKLAPYLSDNEKELIKRGRNSAGRGPRGSDQAVYAAATGFETMIGWLFLENPVRLAQLFDRLEEIELNLE